MLKISGSLLIAVMAAFVLGGCAESSLPVASGKGNLRGINAIVSSPDVGFLIEERQLASLAYKDGSVSRFDNLPYNINFDVLLAGDTSRTRVASEPVNVAANTEYVFALTGALAAPTVLRFEYPERQWSAGATVFDARLLHLATTAGDLDIYLAAPGTAPVLGAARATAAYGEVSEPFEATAGDFEIILTPADDPANVLYRSRAFTQGAGTSMVYGIFDPDPSMTGDLSLRVMGAGSLSAELPDDNSPPTIRFLHASFPTGNVDVFANDEFTTPLVANLGFGEITADIDFANEAVPLTFTPTGDPGVFLLEDSLVVGAGSRSTVFLFGDDGEFDIVAFQESRRPIETTARLRLMHVADNAAGVDLYILKEGEDVNDHFPQFFNLPFRSTTGYANLPEGSYEISITLNSNKTVIGGPLALDLALGDIVEMAMLDTDDPNVVNLLIYDN